MASPGETLLQYGFRPAPNVEALAIEQQLGIKIPKHPLKFVLDEENKAILRVGIKRDDALLYTAARMGLFSDNANARGMYLAEHNAFFQLPENPTIMRYTALHENGHAFIVQSSPALEAGRQTHMTSDGKQLGKWLDFHGIFSEGLAEYIAYETLARAHGNGNPDEKHRRVIEKKYASLADKQLASYEKGVVFEYTLGHNFMLQGMQSLMRGLIPPYDMLTLPEALTRLIMNAPYDFTPMIEHERNRLGFSFTQE